MKKILRDCLFYFDFTNDDKFCSCGALGELKQVLFRGKIKYMRSNTIDSALKDSAIHFLIGIESKFCFIKFKFIYISFN